MPERQSMSEKIEWYKEVLTLEPNSKLFFPLARMLAEEGLIEKLVGNLPNHINGAPVIIEP